MPIRAYCAQTTRKHTGGVFAVAFDKSGRYGLTAGADRVVRLWNPRTGLQIQTFSGHSRQVLCIALNDDGDALYSGADEPSLRVWDVGRGECVRSLRAHSARINSIALYSKHVLATASYDATVALWDTRSRSSEPAQRMDDARDAVTALQFASPCLLAASVDGMLRTYDVRKGVLTVDDVGAPATAISLSRDGLCVLVATLGNGPCFLDRGTGRTLCAYDGCASKSFALGCDVLYDDAYIVSGSEDGNVLLFDIVEGAQPLLRIGDNEVDKEVIGAIASHPSKHLVLAGCHNGVVKLWQIVVSEDD